jgi:hypothetical protein
VTGAAGGPDQDGLERAFRRLLARYPAAHRRMYEEEMLAVLLASAAGRERVGVRATLDLLHGAALAWLRQAARAWAGTTESDALAVVLLLTPPLLLAGAGLGLHEMAWWARSGEYWGFVQTFPQVPAWLAWLAAAWLGLRGRRWPAAVAACAGAALMAWMLTADVFNGLYVGQTAPWVLASALGAVAALASPGARHGLAILGHRRYGVILAGSAVTALSIVVGDHIPGTFVVGWLLPVLVVLACRPGTDTGRRALALLALPGVAYGLSLTALEVNMTERVYWIATSAAVTLWCLLWIFDWRRRQQPLETA